MSERVGLHRGDLVVFWGDLRPAVGIFVHTRHDPVCDLLEYHFLTPRGVIHKYESYVMNPRIFEVVRTLKRSS